MPHVLSFVHALNISWIKRVLDPDNYAPWKVLLTDVLEDLGQDKFWYYSQSAKFNPFWKNVIHLMGLFVLSSSPQPRLAPIHTAWVLSKFALKPLFANLNL
jgi:hypothetical protein